MAAQIRKRPRWPMAAREWPLPAVNGSCGAQPSATFSFRQEPNNRKRERVCFHEKKKPFLFCFMFLTWSVVLLLHLSPPWKGVSATISYWLLAMSSIRFFSPFPPCLFPPWFLAILWWYLSLSSLTPVSTDLLVYCLPLTKALINFCVSTFPTIVHSFNNYNYCAVKFISIERITTQETFF